jgi:redox-sensing transcriptional repressor
MSGLNIEKEQPMATSGIPSPTLRRLTQYLTHVSCLREHHVEWISSSRMGSQLGIPAATVRQDMAYVSGFRGVERRGYSTERLTVKLRSVLGSSRPVGVVVAGTGDCGRAMAQCQELSRLGFEIRCVVDTDPQVVGEKVSSFMVESLDRLPALVRRCGIEVGIVAVLGPHVQQVTDRLVASGVRRVLNVSFCSVTVPRGVTLVEAPLIRSLLELYSAGKVKRRADSQMN